MRRLNALTKKTDISPGGRRVKILVAALAVLLLVSLGANVFLFLRGKQLFEYVRDLDIIYSESYFHFDSLTVESFEEKVASGEELVVVITRPGCPNCQALEAPFTKLAEEMGIADQIYHLNVELFRRDPEAWARFKETYGFEGTPTYARFSGGKQVSSVGWTAETGIDYEAVEQWIGEQGDFWED
jgi:thiol-disulfide isomerase/thioredoxin